MTDPQPSWSEREAARFFPTFGDLPTIRDHGSTVIERGEGPYVFGSDGRRYLEANSGLWNMTLGFSESRLTAAARRQYEDLPGYHTFFGRNTKPSIALAERVVALAPVPMSRAFFTNSGSEANESVAKLLWLISAHEGRPERRKFISRKNAYHGATVMAASLTGKDYVRAFGLPLPCIVMVDCPHFHRNAMPGESEADFCSRLAQALEATILREGPDTIAGFFAEPVMGAGGVIVPPAEYFAHIQPVLRKHQIPLVGDEVICGFGRTGQLWGAQSLGQTPDIIVASKSISAGYFPMGAVLLSKAIDERLTEACEAWTEFPHGFTTGGHPVGCAVSLEAIRIIVEEGILEHVQSMAPVFQSKLAALAGHPLVYETRGVGLMGALDIVADKSSGQSFDAGFRAGERIAQGALQRGLIVRPLGSSVVIAPPFIIDAEQMDDLFSVLSDVLDELRRAAADHGPAPLRTAGDAGAVHE